MLLDCQSPIAVGWIDVEIQVEKCSPMYYAIFFFERSLATRRSPWSNISPFPSLRTAFDRNLAAQRTSSSAPQLPQCSFSPPTLRVFRGSSSPIALFFGNTTQVASTSCLHSASPLPRSASQLFSGPLPLPFNQYWIFITLEAMYRI